jgi:PAS domain S-box-containing protein
VFDASSDGMWVCDGAGAILEINRASEKLNDVRGADFIGKDVECIIREGLVDRSVTLDVLKERRQVSMIQRITRTGRQLLVTGTPVFDEAGGIFLVVVNERDITELNHLRENLQEARQVQEKIQTELARLTLLELRKKEIVAESAQMRQVLSSALKLAHMGVSNILILGESGTGKGLLAKLVHRHSPRSEQPFIQINCAALPESLFEAELFGYETGAFTGAREGGKAGLIELAAGGTLFLDEIGEIPLSVQAKLLKYLDDHELTRLGGGRPRKVECAVVAATNRNLEVLVRQGKFRKDLYYRLNTFTVSIPPLREREADVFELADAYLRTFNRKYGLARRLSPKAMRLLKSHPFPGNVRELVGIIQKAVVMSDSDVLDEAIEESLTGRSPRPAARTGLGRSLPEARAGLELESLKRAMLACATTREMARYLGVSQATVVRKLKKHGLARQ